MRAFTDEELMAWVDGELPPDEAQAVAAAVESDPALAARERPFRESRRILQDAFAAQLRAPVPPRLLATLAPPAPRLRAWRRHSLLALAASLVLAIGLAIGVRLDRPDHEASALALLPADAASLDLALETLPGGEVLALEREQTPVEILPLGTLRTASGRWCRDFETVAQHPQGPRRSRGVACRGDGHWEVQAIARLDAAPPPAAGDDAYHAAGAADVDITSVVGAAERLTPEQEQVQLETRWAN